MAETRTGEVRGGVVVFEAGAPPWPEGTEVRVEPDDARSSLARPSEELRALTGAAGGLPEDLTEDLDPTLRRHPER